jgi:hypothetical protein
MVCIEKLFVLINKNKNEFCPTALVNIYRFVELTMNQKHHIPNSGRFKFQTRGAPNNLSKERGSKEMHYFKLVTCI